MKVAAYQASLAACDTPDALALMREQVRHCENLGVEVLCCPEGMLGGLADYIDEPRSIAIDVDSGQLNNVLAPLASDAVTTIVGFTEIDRDDQMYNSAAVFQRGAVTGVYRKLHPAINRSVYRAGRETPVFTAGALTFGIVICRDSTFPEPARAMASRGATALFVPSNNGMPATRGGVELVAKARACDVARARENGMAVIRADVTGTLRNLASQGSTGIVGQDGAVLSSAEPSQVGLVIADINIGRQ